MVGCLAGSKSSIALDRAMLEVLEIDKEEVPLVVTAEKECLSGAHLQDITFPLCRPDAFAGSGFTIPATLIPVRFQPFRFLKSSLKRMSST